MFEMANMSEGCFWIAIAVGFLVSLPFSRNQRLVKFAIAVDFAAFGISDFVEMCMGAWWRPWWLLAWKVTCLIVMCLLLLQLARMRRIATAVVADSD